MAGTFKEQIKERGSYRLTRTDRKRLSNIPTTNRQLTEAEQRQLYIQEEKRKADLQIKVLEGKIEEKKAKIERIRQWWLSKPQSYRAKSENRKNYNRSVDEVEESLSEYQNRLSIFRNEYSKIEQGYSSLDLSAYAREKASAETMKRQEQIEYKNKLNNNPDLVAIYDTENKKDSNKKIVGIIDKKKNPLPDFLDKQKVLTGQDIDYYNKLTKWMNNSGFNSLPDWTRKTINPKAYDWQKRNEGEMLEFDEKGNIISINSGKYGMRLSPKDYSSYEFERAYPNERLLKKDNGEVYGVESQLFGGYFTIEEYNKKIDEYNENLRIKKEEEKKKDEALKEEAKLILINNNFGEGKSLEKPDNTFNPPSNPTQAKATLFSGNFWEKVWTEAKTIYYSSPFGTSTGVIESQQKEDTEKRYNSLNNLFNPYDLKNSVGVASNFFTIPYKDSKETITQQEKLDYKEKEAGEMLKQLDSISSQSSDDLKPYIQIEGLNILKEKGLGISEKIETKTDDKGNTITTTTMEVTDPAFERRISQDMYEWEKARMSNDTYGQIFIGSRIVATAGLKSYITMKGAGTLYKTLGLPSIKLYKTVQLAEGTAKVPRDFGLLKFTLGAGLTGLYGYSKYQQYKAYNNISKYGGEVFFLETGGELLGIELSTKIGQKTYKYIKNEIKNYRLEKISQPDLSQKGFSRYNKLTGQNERVYMERYGGFKLSKPKSWVQTLKGYQKGQFTGRQYKFLPDEVTAYYQYGGDAFIFDKKGNLIKIVRMPTPSQIENWNAMKDNLGNYKVLDNGKVIKGEPFPYDDPSTHLKWFKSKNIAEFPVPRKSELPINLKGKAFGYSATGEEWVSKEFNPESISYFDSSGNLKTLNTKGAIQYVSGKGVSAGFLRIFTKSPRESLVGKTAKSPIIYADYFDKVQVNKAIKEIKGVDTAGRELKAYIYSKDTGSAGTLNIPKSKREVEGTVEIVERIPIRRQFKIKLAGWSVPIEEQVFTKQSLLSAEELSAITKSIGEVESGAGPLYSSLPLRAGTYKPIYSFIGTSRPSKIYQKVYSKLSVSKSAMNSYRSGISPSSIPPSKISVVSSIVYSSKTSSSPSISPSYSGVSSAISRILNPPSSKIFKTPQLDINLKLKKKIKQRRRLTPELAGLMPDFTSRALGLESENIALKDTMKAINKIQTGFEIRTGGRVKGFSEKNLMKNIL